MPELPNHDPVGTTEELGRALMAEAALFVGRAQYVISQLSAIQNLGISAGYQDEGDETARWLANFNVANLESVLKDLRIADAHLNRVISAGLAYKHKAKG